MWSDCWQVRWWGQGRRKRPYKNSARARPPQKEEEETMILHSHLFFSPPSSLKRILGTRRRTENDTRRRRRRKNVIRPKIIELCPRIEPWNPVRGSEPHRSIDYSRSIIILDYECRARDSGMMHILPIDRSFVPSPVGKWFDNQFNNAYPHTRRELRLSLLHVDDCFSALLRRFDRDVKVETCADNEFVS